MTEQTAPAAEPHMSMTERVAELGITLTIKDGPVRSVDHDGWQHNAYRVTLRRRADGRNYSITVGMRYGLSCPPPSAADVLDSLLIDASAFHSCADLAEFIHEFGYDLADDDGESRKAARKAWAMLTRQTPKLIAFLGGDAGFEQVADFTDSL